MVSHIIQDLIICLMNKQIFKNGWFYGLISLILSRWSGPFAISILRRSNNISSMYNDNIIYLSRLFLVFSSSRAFLSQNNVHAPLFKILIFSTAAARAFGSSQMRQQTSLMFFSLVGTHTSLPMWDVDTQLEMIQYSLYSQDGL